MATEKYNTRIHDLVARLPGVTTKNLQAILDKGQSLDHLNKLTTVRIQIYPFYICNTIELYSIGVHHLLKRYSITAL